MKPPVATMAASSGDGQTEGRKVELREYLKSRDEDERRLARDELTPPEELRRMLDDVMGAAGFPDGSDL